LGTAKFMTLQLARFEGLRAAGPIGGELPEGLLFCTVGADWRASGSDLTRQEAFVFLLLGLHDSVAAAHEFVAARGRVAPWMGEACEVYAAVLEPYRHKGEVNFLDRDTPRLLFDGLGMAAGSEEPFISITSVGWNVGPELDMNRVREFSNGVMAVRMAMTGMAGLHSQQTFAFEKGIAVDPVTVTFWKDDAAARQFAYGPAVHKLPMDRYRMEDLADRTSFTRCRVVESEGSWYGRDPQDWGGG
jgi:hypothetical protein